MDRSTGRWTPDVLAADCTHVVGDYWAVWPAAFHTNMTRADRGDPRRVWGVTFRADPAWARQPHAPPGETRLAWVFLAGDAAPRTQHAAHWRWAFPRTTCVDRRPTLHVHLPDGRPE